MLKLIVKCILNIEFCFRNSPISTACLVYTVLAPVPVSGLQQHGGLAGDDCLGSAGDDGGPLGLWGEGHHPAALPQAHQPPLVPLQHGQVLGWHNQPGLATRPRGGHHHLAPLQLALWLQLQLAGRDQLPGGQLQLVAVGQLEVLAGA